MLAEQHRMLTNEAQHPKLRLIRTQFYLCGDQADRLATFATSQKDRYFSVASPLGVAEKQSRLTSLHEVIIGTLFAPLFLAHALDMVVGDRYQDPALTISGEKRGGGMLIKSTLSFFGRSVLVGAIFPGLLFTTQAYAHAPSTKKKGKAPHAQNAAASKSQRYKQQFQVTRKRTAKTNTAARTLPLQHQQANVLSQTVKTLPLGAFTLRAYTQYHEPEEQPSRTATGTLPESGRTVAVDPTVIPFGTKIYIKGIGERIAEDSGAKIKGKQIDVFLPSPEHCRQFGVQSRDVMVMIE